MSILINTISLSDEVKDYYNKIDKHFKDIGYPEVSEIFTLGLFTIDNSHIDTVAKIVINDIIPDLTTINAEDAEFLLKVFKFHTKDLNDITNITGAANQIILNISNIKKLKEFIDFNENSSEEALNNIKQFLSRLPSTYTPYMSDKGWEVQYKRNLRTKIGNVFSGYKAKKISDLVDSRHKLVTPVDSLKTTLDELLGDLYEVNFITDKKDLDKIIEDNLFTIYSKYSKTLKVTWDSSKRKYIGQHYLLAEVTKKDESEPFAYCVLTTMLERRGWIYPKSREDSSYLIRSFGGKINQTRSKLKVLDNLNANDNSTSTLF